MNALAQGIVAGTTPSNTTLAAIETIDRRQSLALVYYLSQRTSPFLIGNGALSSPEATCIASLR